MKRLIACFVAALLALSFANNTGAQSLESIWLTASTTEYKTGETVLVTVNAASSTPIQGFTFQIRYDPACLRPVNASSPVPGMNGLPLPQLAGVVDGSYASTAPQIVNGILAEVRFIALKGCQTNLALESAALAVRDGNGFAAPLASVIVGERNVSLFIDPEVGVAQTPSESGSILPLEPPAEEPVSITGGVIGFLLILLILGVLFGMYQVVRMGTPR
ncbi:MAG: cohesin domain-containing protein [Chloroflexota bacterium]